MSVVPVILSGRQAFDPRATLFAHNEPGVWYDASDLGAMFQDSAGTTPVTAVEQAVGLILDKSRGLAQSTVEGFLPGTANSFFSTPDSNALDITGDIDLRVRLSMVDWTPAVRSAVIGKTDAYVFLVGTTGALTFWGYPAGVFTSRTSSVSTGFADGSTNWIRVTNSAAGCIFYTSVDGSTWTQLGTTQTQISGSLSTNTNILEVGARGGSGGTEPLAGAVYQAQVYSGVNGTLVANFDVTRYTSGATFVASTGETWTINGSARIKPAGTHAIQASSASRPVLRNRYNLLTYSEGLTNAAYSVVRSTIAATTAVSPPSGVATIFKLTEDSTASNTHFFLSAADTTVISGQSYRTTIVARAAERSWIALQEGQGVTATAYFNLATGAIGTISGTGSPSAAIADLGGGWYRCTLNWTALGTAGRIRVFVATGDGTVSYTGDGTSGVYLSATEIRPSIDTIYPYQRIAAATDYDSDASKFPLYLAFDGSDDSLYTAANLDLSGTDKVTVFAGVTKLSDAARGVVAELTAGVPTNNGSFNLNAPYTAAADYGAASKGTNAVDLTLTTYASPHVSVLTMSANIGADDLTVRINGVQAGNNTNDQGTGNFASAVLNIGRRNNASLPYNGRLHQLIVRGAQSSAAEIASTERFIAGKQGRAL